MHRSILDSPGFSSSIAHNSITEKSLERAGSSRPSVALYYVPIKPGSQKDASGTCSVASETREEPRRALPPLASLRECAVKFTVAQTERTELLTAGVGLERQMGVEGSLA